MKGKSSQHTYFAYKLPFGVFCTGNLRTAVWIFPQLKRLSPVEILDLTPTRQGSALHPETTVPAGNKRGPHEAPLCAMGLETLELVAQSLCSSSHCRLG